MSYHFRSRFVYGLTPTDWTTTLPTRAWGRRTGTVAAGSRTAAGGVPAAYVVRRDHVLSLTVRIYEAEWPDLHGVIEWGQFAEQFTWYPDAGGLVHALGYAVWLEHPQAPNDVTPNRSDEYPLVLEQEIHLRRADGLPWDLDFYDGIAP